MRHCNNINMAAEADKITLIMSFPLLIYIVVGILCSLTMQSLSKSYRFSVMIQIKIHWIERCKWGTTMIKGNEEVAIGR